MIPDYDFLVIGGGIAGTTIAAHLAERGSVLVLEMESQPGYHSTGRSAAVFSDVYGNDVIRALTRASRPLFFDPPAEFCSGPLVHPRDVLIVAQDGQEERFDAFIEMAASLDPIKRLPIDDAVARLPILKRDALRAVGLGSHTADIEVHELQQAYLRMFKARGGELATCAKVTGLSQGAGRWTVETERSSFQATVVVNAAGAWAGQIAALAGATDIGLRPLKRTACLLTPPEGASVADWPILFDVDEQFYLKPDAGLLMLSPADEGETEPCDAQADELDIAIAVDRVERVTTLEVRRIGHRWAGLRSFVADSSPVVGFDPLQSGFFWFAALGGYGIQTAPALGRLAASLAAGRAVDTEIIDFGVDPSTLAPGRSYQTNRGLHLIGVASLG